MTLESEKPRLLAVIALDEEYEIFLEKFPEIKDLSTETQILTEHFYGNNTIQLFSVLANKMGAKSSALAVEVAVRKFKPHAVVVIGIAGGLTDDVKVGDVCISSEIVDVLHNNKVGDEGKGGNLDLRFSPDHYAVDAEYITSFRFLKIHPSLKSLYKSWKADTKSNEHNLGIPDDETEYNMHVKFSRQAPTSAKTVLRPVLRESR